MKVEVFFYGEGDIWDIRGASGPAVLRPLTDASTIALLGHPGHWPTSTRW